MIEINVNDFLKKFGYNLEIFIEECAYSDKKFFDKKLKKILKINNFIFNDYKKSSQEFLIKNDFNFFQLFNYSLNRKLTKIHPYFWSKIDYTWKELLEEIYEKASKNKEAIKIIFK